MPNEQDHEVGYVIADYLTPELAAAAERSVREHRPGSEVIVVDAHHLSLGYSQALNHGVAQLGPRVKYVCCLNADVEMTELDEEVRFRFRLDDKLAIVGPRQVDEEGRIAHGGIVPYEDGTEWDLDLRHRCWLWEPSELAEQLTRVDLTVPMVPGSVFYIRRDVLKALGGWPGWTWFYYEDAWLCYAARARGYRVLYTGAVTWLHYGQRSPIGQLRREVAMQVARNQFVRMCKHHGIPLRQWGDDHQSLLASEVGER